VQAPKPTITSISPDPVYAFSANQTFTITGTNFLLTTKVSFDGQVYTGNMTFSPTQITFIEPTPRRLGALAIQVSNDGFETQTDTRNITLVASASGINTTPVFGPLLTDDMSESIYGEVLGLQPFTVRVSIFATCIGASSCTPTKQSISDLGTPPPSLFSGTWPANFPDSISSGGRYFIYTPQARIGAGQSPVYGPAYVYDRCKGATVGCAPSSYRITVPSDGSAPSNDTGGGGCGFQTGSCPALGQAASISGDGRYVVFQSELTNLVPGDTNGVMDVFFRDMCLGAAAGCVPTTVRIAAAADSPSMSKDARFIFYRAMPSAAIHAYDTCLGQGGGCMSSDVVVSVDDTSTTVGVGYGLYRTTRDGRFLAFGNYLRDTCLGVVTACTPTTVQLSGIALVDSVAPDGAHVAVTTTGTFGDTADTNGLADVYVIKTCLGAAGPCTQVAKRISVDAQGIQVGGSNATFSPDGQRLIYNQNFQGVVITSPLSLP
jgi:hypothetical protein